MDEAATLQITEKGVGLVTMNRPQHLNAFNEEFCRGLIKAMQDAEENDAVKVIVLTGTGLAFSAGNRAGNACLVGKELFVSGKLPKDSKMEK